MCERWMSQSTMRGTRLDGLIVSPLMVRLVQALSSPLMLSVAIHCRVTRWLVFSTRGASILQLHRGSSSSRSVSPASLPSLWGESVRLSAAAMSKAPKGTSVYSVCVPAENKKLPTNAGYESHMGKKRLISKLLVLSYCSNGK